MTHGYYQIDVTPWHAFQVVILFWRIIELTVRSCPNLHVAMIFLLLNLRKPVAVIGCVLVSNLFCIYSFPISCNALQKYHAGNATQSCKPRGNSRVFELTWISAYTLSSKFLFSIDVGLGAQEQERTDNMQDGQSSNEAITLALDIINMLSCPLLLPDTMLSNCRERKKVGFFFLGEQQGYALLGNSLEQFWHHSPLTHLGT